MQPCAAGAGFCLRIQPHGPSLESVAALNTARPPKLVGAGPSTNSRRAGFKSPLFTLQKKAPVTTPPGYRAYLTSLLSSPARTPG